MAETFVPLPRVESGPVHNLLVDLRLSYAASLVTKGFIKKKKKGSKSVCCNRGKNTNILAIYETCFTCESLSVKQCPSETERGNTRAPTQEQRWPGARGKQRGFIEKLI